ncbi:DUF2752 domain-containing protein [Winogradskyella litorisediminis]|uniref:DUF2752 domain-containing protein n=1 Tax=Winogradskyella litorisediminis TaxID=1156618 RepID=A0ABW3N8S2_9FLAO
MKLLKIQLDDYMLPCLWKKNFGIDCMGCGMQRSLNFLIQGEFVAAFKMYPAIYTLIIMFAFLILHLKFKFEQGHKIILGLFILNISIIVISFLLKTF